MRHTKTWTISLPPQMEREVLKVAKVEQRTKSELIREALREYMLTHRLKEIQRIGAKRASALGIRTEADIERIIDEIRS